MNIYIKNMACSCCKVLVKDELEKMGLHVVKVELGEVEVKEQLNKEQIGQLNAGLKKAGLEVVDNRKGILVGKIKKAINERVFNGYDEKSPPFSKYLAEKLNYDYNYLSGFFSEIEATTIEQYIIALKIERVKELIMFHDITLTEIAYQFGYSSVAHLSGQFKKVTGLSASHFKKLKRTRADVSNRD